jgi:hypothetical protein
LAFALVIAFLVCTALAPAAAAAITVYEEGDKRLEVGVGLQFQYHLVDPQNGDETDELIARRVRPDIRGTVTKGWDGRLFFEMGKASGDNEVKLLDAWMRHKSKLMNTTVGSRKAPFSREFLASAWTQELVERSFVGDPNYGTPDRALGLFLDGRNDGKTFAWAAMVGSLALDPDVRKLNFENPVNWESDYNEGWVAAARLELHPRGAVPYDQGDLERGPFRYTVGLAAFTWSNDDDNNTYTDAAGSTTSTSKVDVDSADGLELSVGLRGGGFSFDAEAQRIEADTLDPSFTGGLFRDGTTSLDKLGLEAGFMLASERFEIVAGHQSLDADNYQDAWVRTEVGFNVFWNLHKAKLQLTYRVGESLNGIEGADADELFVQFQFLF